MGMKIKTMAIVMGLVLTGCTAEVHYAEQSGTQRDEMQQLTIDAVETEWQGETLSVTRSGETLEGLRAVVNPAAPADGEGFGIYCSALGISNIQVIWLNSDGKWKIGGNYNTYWLRNQSGTLDIYAYAPYKASAPNIVDGVLTYEAQHHDSPGYTDWLSGSNVDLLYASRTGYARNSSESAVLMFRHALAKITFGTITNNTGGTLSLNGFTISGTLYDSAELNLETGVWSNHVANAIGKISTPPPFDSSVFPPLSDKETIIPPPSNRELLFIPGPDGTLPLTVEVNSSIANEKFSFEITLEQGKNKTCNITVSKNFEVVIQEQ